MNTNTPTTTTTTKKQQQQQLNTVIEQLKDKEFQYQEQPIKQYDWTNYLSPNLRNKRRTPTHTRHCKQSRLQPKPTPKPNRTQRPRQTQI